MSYRSIKLGRLEFLGDAYWSSNGFLIPAAHLIGKRPK
jgi:hypothetical protein